MTEPLKLGLAGIGTVGTGLVQLIAARADALVAKTGRPIEIVAVSARNKRKKRGIDLSNMRFVSDPVALANDPEIDVFVELIGGEEGPAKEAVEAALQVGKHVVTANKALLAHHGSALAALAEKHGAALNFEGAVAGGIPVVKAIREGLQGNDITRVFGILNGTCNYILTKMERDGRDFADVLTEAQDQGYAEADPTFDVGGFDTAHKLALLTSLAFGTRTRFDTVYVEGIETITPSDIEAAADLGYRIKLLGVAQRTARGLEQRMQPCLVPSDSPLGQLEGGTNMVVIEGDSVEQVVLRGPGAGEGPTASAVMGDVCDLARGLQIPTFGRPATSLEAAKPAVTGLPAPYYLRLGLLDKPGALAKVAAILGDAGVSIDWMRQYAHAESTAPVLIVTHKTTRAALDVALDGCRNTDVVAGEPVALRIEEV